MQFCGVTGIFFFLPDGLIWEIPGDLEIFPQPIQEATGENINNKFTSDQWHDTTSEENSEEMSQLSDNL